MRPYRTLLQRCLGAPFHTSGALLAASSLPRRTSKASRHSSASTAVEVDGEVFHPTEYAGAASTITGSSSHRQRRSRTPRVTAAVTPSQGAAAAAVNPVELLLHKHDVRTGGSGGGSSGGSEPGSGGGRGSGHGGSCGRSKRVPLAPPTKAETAAAAAAAEARARGDVDRRTTHASVEEDAAEGEEEVVEDAAAGSSQSATSNSDDYQKSLQVLTNPFRGLHGDVSRSYRIDQLLEAAKPEDVMLARQERKSTAFSFLSFKAGENFYKSHWESLPELQQHLDSTLAAHVPLRNGASVKAAATPYVRGTPLPGLTLFNNDLGLQSPTVQCSYPLIVAQRLLLFPDHLRQFHTVCGREDVPCDFFADIDLPGESAAGAEKALLEVLNYLEVRLPGVGFTDPFFLVLTNAVPGTDKISFHLHARSMTYVRDRQTRAEQQLLAHATNSTSGGGKHKSAQKAKLKKGKHAARSGSADEDVDDGVDEADEECDMDDYDDLSDMVNVVDNNNNAEGTKKLSGPTKLIAFQDYRTVKLIGDEVNQTLGRDVIDMNCYRPNGMLRCAFSSKLPSAQDHDFCAKQQDRHGAAAAAARKRLIPLVTASDPALQKRLSAMEDVLRTMTDPEILEMTFCTRHMDHDAKVQKLVHEHAKGLVVLDSHAGAGSAWRQRSAEVLQATLTHRWKLIRPRHVLGPQAAQAVEYDVYGNAVSPFLTEGAKWRRYKAVTAKLRTLPPRAAESYDVWVRVGLALHNFSNEDNCFEEWVLFSLKSPQKYSREVCRKKWLQFERNPDALNWRRGYNYLNSTVWRQV
jgi:hypothetical protein